MHYDRLSQQQLIQFVYTNRISYMTPHIQDGGRDVISRRNTCTNTEM